MGKYQLLWEGKDKVIEDSENYSPKESLLIPNKKRSINFNTTKNIIVEGDNLPVLSILKSMYKGKVKMIYIDPPYNTGCKRRGYKDKFWERKKCKHSKWLSMMYPRLKLARELLRDDGVIFVSIDDNEQANLKLLMDEIFGEGNFVNNIALKSSTPSGIKTTHKDKTIIKQKEYILVYAKYKQMLILKPQYKKRSKWDDHYNSFITDNNEIKPLINILQEHGFNFKTLKEIEIENKDFKKFYTEYKAKIFRISHTMPEVQKIKSKKKPNQIIQYLDNNNNNQYAYNGGRISFLEKQYKEIIENENNKLKRFDELGILLCDFWDDIDFNNTQNEVKEIKFTSAKKPLKLLYRIIDMTIHKDDIILDFFAGSGTTGHAVMQMNLEEKKKAIEKGEDPELVGNRKYIMVQLPEAIDEKSDAYKAGYKKISDITIDRIKRAGKKIKEELKNIEAEMGIDLGFKVFELTETNLKSLENL